MVGIRYRAVVKESINTGRRAGGLSCACSSSSTTTTTTIPACATPSSTTTTTTSTPTPRRNPINNHTQQLSNLLLPHTNATNRQIHLPTLLHRQP